MEEDLQCEDMTPQGGPAWFKDKEDNFFVQVPGPHRHIPLECAITWLPNGNGAGWYPASGRKLHFYSGGSTVDMIENGTAEFLSSRGILACFAGLVFKSASWDQRGLHNRALWQEDLGSLEMRLLRILRGSQSTRLQITFYFLYGTKQKICSTDVLSRRFCTEFEFIFFSFIYLVRSVGVVCRSAFENPPRDISLCGGLGAWLPYKMRTGKDRP